MGKKIILLILIVAISFISVPYQVIYADSIVMTVSLTPIADTYVRNGIYSSDNYGTDALLPVNNTKSVDYTREAYIMFDYTSLGTIKISDAKIRVYCYLNAHNTTLNLYSVSNEWSENKLTWNNKPALDIHLGSVQNNPLYGWVEYDITSFLQECADSKVAFGFVNSASTENNFKNISSKEGDYPPQLHITYTSAAAVKINTPVNGQNFTKYDVIAFNATPTCNNEINSATLKVDGVKYAEFKESPYVYSLSNLSIGTHNLNITAIDKNNVTTSTSVNIIVNDTPTVYDDYLYSGANGKLYDWTNAGYNSGQQIPSIDSSTVSVTSYGAIPDDNLDDTVAIQNTIDAVGQAGGGVVYFPAGRYDINVDPDSWNVLRVNYSNVVLRGAGSGTDGTIIQQWRADPHIYDIPPVDADGDYVITVGTEYPETSAYKTITEDAPQGSYKLNLDSTSGISAGDVVLIRMLNPVDNNNNRLDTLSRELCAPLEPDPDWENFARYAPFQFAVEVESVLSNTEIMLKQPMPRLISTQYRADLRKLNMNLKEIGVENLRIKGMFGGGYTHHGSAEFDYGWNGVKFKGIRNGWIDNVVVEDCVQDVTLKFCYNVTVKNSKNYGLAGHFGYLLLSSWSCMVTDCEQYAPRTHNVSVSGDSMCNVFKDIKNLTTQAGSMDFHGGGFPSYNLFENMENMRAEGAGYYTNMPHSGQYNVFWNVKCGKYVKVNDFFHYGLFVYQESDAYTRDELYKLFPKSVLVGVYDPDYTIDVNGNTDNQDTEWIYVEDMNNGPVYPLSLYDAQKNPPELLSYKVGEVLYTDSKGNVTDILLNNGSIDSVMVTRFCDADINHKLAVSLFDDSDMLIGIKLVNLDGLVSSNETQLIPVNMQLPDNIKGGRVKFMIWNLSTIEPLINTVIK